VNAHDAANNLSLGQTLAISHLLNSGEVIRIKHDGERSLSESGINLRATESRGSLGSSRHGIFNILYYFFKFKQFCIFFAENMVVLQILPI